MRISRWLGPALALTLLSLPLVGADATPKPDPDSGMTATPLGKTKVKLDEPKHGKAALKALAGQLDVAAGLNRMSIKKLHDVLANDSAAWISQTGRLFYADTFEEHTSARTSTTSGTASIPPATEPLADTFKLHSIPGGSDHTIYLDFNGVTLTAGGWTLNGYKQGTYKGFSLDADYGTFSDSERAYVQHVWQVIAEKYAPLDIDVTTQNPGADAYNRNGAGDPTYGDHVVFTDVATGSGAKPSAVCPNGCGGVAFNGTFNDPDDNLDLGEPVWVYTGNYHWYSGLAGEIGAHEIGHSLGLSHDGLGAGDNSDADNAAYYGGNDLWSPVMGNGVGALTQFSKGEYTNASNTEDDFAVMQTYGVSLRSDDWGDLNAPSDLGAQPNYTIDGVIEDAADTDVFKVAHSCIATARIRARGIGAGQTADLRVLVRSAVDNSVVADSNDTTTANLTTYPRTPRGADASLDYSNPLNEFLIEVDGVGQGVPTTGYSDYGSVGRYHLTISGCADALGSTPGTITSFSATQTSRTATLTLGWHQPGALGDGPLTGFRITGLPSGTIDVPATDRTAVFTGLTPGTTYDLGVAAINQFGAGPVAKLTKHLNSWTPLAAPKVKPGAWGTTMVLDWTEPANPGRAIGTFWKVKVYVAGSLVDSFDTEYGYSGIKITGVGNGHYKLEAFLNYDADLGTRSGIASTTVDVGPSAPRIGTPSSGTAGGTATATVRWAAPYTLRGQTITSYTIGAYKLDSSGRIVKVYVSSPRKASARSYVWALPAGRYKFRVQAHSQGGYTPISAYSTIATSR